MGISRVCKKCNQEKYLELFYKKKKGSDYYYLYTCKDCYKAYNSNYLKSYYKENSAKLIQSSKDWYKCNLLKKKEYDEKYVILNKDSKRAYYRSYFLSKKTKINARLRSYYLAKRKNNLLFKIKSRVSYSVYCYLKKNNSSKCGESVINCLPYTIAELKLHLESQFEPWMNWFNWGVYKVDEWDDNNQLTWKWNIDHIIPQSKLQYTSMSDDNFKKCWSLCNLRPYSAKQNILDGASSIRHV